VRRVSLTPANAIFRLFLHCMQREEKTPKTPRKQGFVEDFNGCQKTPILNFKTVALDHSATHPKSLQIHDLRSKFATFGDTRRHIQDTFHYLAVSHYIQEYQRIRIDQVVDERGLGFATNTRSV
jgi:hypothetical protein